MAKFIEKSEDEGTGLTEMQPPKKRGGRPKKAKMDDFDPHSGIPKSDYRSYANNPVGGGVGQVSPDTRIPEADITPEIQRPTIGGGGTKLGSGGTAPGLISSKKSGEKSGTSKTSLITTTGKKEVSKEDSRALAEAIAEVYEFLIQFVGREVLVMKKEQIKNRLDKNGVDVSVLALPVLYKEKTMPLADVIDMLNDDIRSCLTVEENWKKEFIEKFSKILFDKGIGFDPMWGCLIFVGKDLLVKGSSAFAIKRKQNEILDRVVVLAKEEKERFNNLKNQYDTVMSQMSLKDEELRKTQEEMKEIQRRFAEIEKNPEAAKKYDIQDVEPIVDDKKVIEPAEDIDSK